MESLKGPANAIEQIFVFTVSGTKAQPWVCLHYRSSHETGWVSSEGKPVRGECKKSGLLKPNRLATHPRSSTGFNPGTRRTLLQYGVFCMLCRSPLPSTEFASKQSNKLQYLSMTADQKRDDGLPSERLPTIPNSTPTILERPE